MPKPVMMAVCLAGCHKSASTFSLIFPRKLQRHMDLLILKFSLLEKNVTPTTIPGTNTLVPKQ